MSLFRKNLTVSVALLLVGAALIYWWQADTATTSTETVAEDQGTNSDRAIPGGALAVREREADKAFWNQEVLAENCGRIFESLWDSVNAGTNKLSLIAGFPVPEIILPQFSSPQALGLGMTLWEPSHAGKSFSSNHWSEWVNELGNAGWKLNNLEFRHTRFDTNDTGQASQSGFYFAARLTRSQPPERAMVEGELVVDWDPTRLEAGRPSVKRIDASRLQLRTGTGQTPFEPILQERIFPPGNSTSIDPLILYDLDGDGLSEIILAAQNVVYRRKTDGSYAPQPLCRYPLDWITTALVADFDGDGAPDLLCANAKGLFLFKGSPNGTFDEPPRLVWTANPPLKNAMVLTCGDIDQDGDLDVFLGQYRVPTLGQFLRPYYYDANDGWPAHLLVNDGAGNFADQTEKSGLGPKQWRRIYSASLVDLDGDGHLDLVVVSDFAGLDLYRNDGRGHFADMTRQWVDEGHGFGMAHALADFNADGRLDLLMIGMTSPTVDRLEHLGLYRPYSAEDRLRRPAMAAGNRLYLAKPDGGYYTNLLSASIARSGWSWGCSAFDFNNDGFPDLYIANGLETKQSVRDYESEFWLHHLFVEADVDDVSASRYLMDQFSHTRGQGWSYGGYEKNRLFLNQRGESFIEIGHLAGVALEQDSRNVVAADLDGDGRVDLMVTTFEAWPEIKQTVQIYKNRLTDPGHWIGFHFREQGGGKSPVGASVTISYQGHTSIRQIVTGDSHRSQHPNTLHFGLGGVDKLDTAQIRWIGGPTLTLTNPAVDKYCDVLLPENRPGSK